MQVANANPEIKITGRHVAVTDAIVDYARKKVESLHLDYPRIIDAQVVLDVEKYRHIAEVLLHCSNHITIDASAETSDLYASIDEAVGKIAQQMRKHKTKIMRQHRPRRAQTRLIEEQILADEVNEEPDNGAEPLVVRVISGNGVADQNVVGAEQCAEAVCEGNHAGLLPPRSGAGDALDEGGDAVGKAAEVDGAVVVGHVVERAPAVLVGRTHGRRQREGEGRVRHGGVVARREIVDVEPSARERAR